jgi:uncharacterized protein YjiS (DUF1127 family)
MTHEISHEVSYRNYVETAQDERAEAVTRLGFLVIVGTDRALRRTGAALKSAVGDLAERWRRYRTERETYRALAALDDRLLRDIGLTRADVEQFTEDLLDERNRIEAPTVAAVTQPTTYADLKRAA